MEENHRTAGTSDAWGVIVDALYPALIRILTGLLIVVLCAWMLVGGINMVLEIGNAFGSGWASAAEHMIINALILLALLEVIRTLQAYLKLGRVRVTFILDTALVVLISELMGLWFREYAPEKVLLGLGVIVTLVVLRIVTAKFSPEAAAGGGEPGSRPGTLQTPATATDGGSAGYAGAVFRPTAIDAGTGGRAVQGAAAGMTGKQSAKPPVNEVSFTG